jgi:hypothetical protein
VRGIVFKKEFDNSRNEQRAALQTRIALDKRAGGDAARDDLQRYHRAAAHDHLVRIVVFAAAQIVRRQTAKVEQSEDAGGGLSGKPSFSADDVTARAIAGRDIIGLRHHELLRLAWVLVENLRFTARYFAALIHRKLLDAHFGLARKRLQGVDAIGEQARALRRGADVDAGIEHAANFGRIDARRKLGILAEQT